MLIVLKIIRYTKCIWAHHHFWGFYDNSICFIAFLDVLSTKNDYQKMHTKSGLLDLPLF